MSTPIKVNCHILGKMPGAIVEVSDKDYSVFEAWATKKDRRGGLEICQFIEPAIAVADEDIDLEKKAMTTSGDVLHKVEDAFPEPPEVVEATSAEVLVAQAAHMIKSSKNKDGKNK